MNMFVKPQDEEKVREALELLQDVARDEGQHLRELAGDGFEELKSVLAASSSNGEKSESSGRIAALKHRGKRKVRVVAGRVDHYVHSSPWQVTGVAAACGLVVGMLLDRVVQSRWR